ncbi:hypothetical protein [Parafrankia sp. FMc2]|uniref:hypothetical protein n=1 Tax=Parafrankia sp. FMc2 TaxID=3233196 RepID=UPI0034D41EBF
MTADFTNTLRTVQPVADRAPEAMRDLVPTIGGEATDAARDLVKELEYLAARLAQTAQRVREGKDTGAVTPGDFARTAEKIGTYEATRKAWNAMAKHVAEQA